MRILFRPEARTEVLEAKTWYEARSVGLGLEFARSLDAAVATAFRDPAAYSQVEGDDSSRTSRRHLTIHSRGTKIVPILLLSTPALGVEADNLRSTHVKPVT